MGINGLLQLLDPVTRKTTLEEFRGKRVGVDAMCWLHRGCYSCVWDLCTNKPTTKYLSFCEKMLLLFKNYDITPIMVVDGENLKAKAKEDERRRESREQHLKEGRQYEKEGNRKEAYKQYVQAISITSSMIKEFLLLLIKHKIPYIIAPYESDAQLAYLARTGLVDVICTEDSDTLCYQCPHVLFKLTPEGTCVTIDLDDIYETNKVDMINWTPELFEIMCVLNGCDYASGCNQIGLKTARKYINKGKTKEMILENLKSIPKHQFINYEPLMNQAICCFHHQVIFNPILNQREYLTPLTQEEVTLYLHQDSCTFGDLKEDVIATRLAKGLVCDEKGTLLLPKDCNVDYLDQFFKNCKLTPVSKRYAIQCNMKKEDSQEIPNNYTSISIPCTVKSLKREFSSIENKQDYEDSPTSTVPKDMDEYYSSFLELSLSDDLVSEIERIENTLEFIVCSNETTYTHLNTLS